MSRDPAAYKLKPIPSSAEVIVRKKGYREETPINFAGQLANEECVEVRSLGLLGANHYNTPLNPPYYLSVPGSIEGLYLRTSVAERLMQVNSQLALLGVELWLFDAWRPQAIQRYFHDVWFPDWLRARNPQLYGQELMDEVEKYWAAPTAGANSPSPHATGAAVDLQLVFRETRQPLYMGGVFDELTSLAWADHYETIKCTSMSDEEARANRRLLYWVMTEAGFANNATEWWHYSWGDQLWARLYGQSAAHYGGCVPQGLSDV